MQEHGLTQTGSKAVRLPAMGLAEPPPSHPAALNWHAVRVCRPARQLWEHERRASAVLASRINRAPTNAETRRAPGVVKRSCSSMGVGAVHHRAGIGRNSVLYQQLTIGSSSTEGAPPPIGDGVEILRGANVVDDIMIGDDTRIGANALAATCYPPRWSRRRCDARL